MLILIVILFCVITRALNLIMLLFFIHPGQCFFIFSREKKFSRNGSLKVLDHSMSGQYGVENCNKFIDILGLRTIFPLFMKTPKKNRKRTLTIEEHEGKLIYHVVVIVKIRMSHLFFITPFTKLIIVSQFINNHK